MHLYFPVKLEQRCSNFAENNQNQYKDTQRMQHGEHTQIVLTIYTALCSLHKLHMRVK